MTRIGIFPHNISLRHDLFGTAEQSGLPDESLAGSAAKKGSFEALLSNLTQPAEEGAAFSDNPQSNPGAQTENSASAAGSITSSTASQEDGQSAREADLMASLTAASTPRQSAPELDSGTTQPMNAAPDGEAASIPTSDSFKVARLFDALSRNSAQAPMGSALDHNADTRAGAPPARPVLATTGTGATLPAEGPNSAAATTGRLTAAVEQASSTAVVPAAQHGQTPDAVAASIESSGKLRALPQTMGTASPLNASLPKPDAGQTGQADNFVRQVPTPPAMQSIGPGSSPDEVAHRVQTGDLPGTAPRQPASSSSTSAGLEAVTAKLPRSGGFGSSLTATAAVQTAAAGMTRGVAFDPASSAGRAVDAAAAQTPGSIALDASASRAAAAQRVATQRPRSDARSSSSSATAAVQAAVASTPQANVKTAQSGARSAIFGAGPQRTRASADEARSEAAADPGLSPTTMPADQPAIPIAMIAEPVAAPMAQVVPGSSTGVVAPSARHSARSQAMASLAEVSQAGDVRAEATANASVAASSANTVEMTVTALSSATHFAPVTRLSPTQQIVDALAASAASLIGRQNGLAAPMAANSDTDAAASATSPTDALSAAAQPSAAAIKTLDLQLQPETLGQVTIRLNLSDSGLAVQLETARQRTAELIDRDKQSIMRGLSQSGYSVTSLEVTVAPQHGASFSSDASSQQGQANPNAGQTGGQSSSFGGSSNGDRSGENASALAETMPGSQNQAVRDDLSPARGNRGGDLFL
jgi:Flagellar hook-length control protein FliK